MKLCKNEINLLKILNNHEVLSLEQISFFLKNSTVSSRKYLNNLNKFLNKYKLGFIKNNKRDGYKIFFDKDLNSLKSLKPIDILEPEERQNYLICRLIFEEMITLTSLVEELNINRNTLVIDLKKIKKNLKKFNLKIISLPWKGIKLEGNNYDIISFSLQFITKFFHEKDLNSNLWGLYGIFINPKMKEYIDLKLINCNFNKIEQILINLLKTIKFSIGPYTYTSLKSIFIYQYLKYNSYNKNN